ncbi:alpha-galactosidase [Asanoa ishikariensis]|uniref:Alpha-galactosidase n=1 Tax=Asanoa ishikariensis TaxID=137265 RepID=A0A1H3QYF5_9ACTN|nr:NPCBM/NEW2 domain-containing protein [Asanoa ishikariensis]GIF64576.1 alpha-galactosidase [Asanoa ishikariensis]SDZ18574.1 alpha-galactosidase [Asanoa ishikariensis]
MRKPLSFLAVTLLAASTLVATAPAASAATPVVPVTAPPMGWNSWNRFGCNIDENLIKQTADAIVANNLDDLGYRYVNIDDCWMASTRDAQGRLQPHPTRFAGGIKALADYVHARGLKLGIYESAGTATCQGLPGSLDHEVVDANTFAAWEVDLLKYDNCNNQGRPDAARYKAMGDALKASGRAIVYSICNWGLADPWVFAPQVGGSLWRTTGDISDNWGSVLSLLDQQNGLEPFARNNGFNDPDMLEVGNGGMTTTEYTAHFSLWALLNSPLLLGNDLRSMSAATLGIIRNADVIAVNQDWGGSQGRKLRDFGETEVWGKPMSDGGAAVVLFNRSAASATITTSAAEVGLGGSSGYNLRNLWTGATTTSTGAISASVPAHGAVMFRVNRTGTPAAAPAAGTHQVGDIAWLASSNFWGPAERNRANGEQAAADGGTLTINGTTYAKGVGTHADSAVHLYLGRACPLFTANVGIDDEVTNAAASVRFQVYGDGKLLAYSGIKRAADGPTRLSVATGGYTTLELRVTDGRDNANYDHADWGGATLTCTAPGTGSNPSFTGANGWGPAERDQSNGEQAAGDGAVLTSGGVSYVRGIGGHSPGDLTVNLGGTCERFTAVAGIDAEVTSATARVVFTVLADGVTLYTSPPVTLASGPSVVDLDVTGRGTLRLVLGDGGNGIDFDHADWADARLLC